MHRHMNVKIVQLFQPSNRFDYDHVSIYIISKQRVRTSGKYLLVAGSVANSLQPARELPAFREARLFIAEFTARCLTLS